MLGTKAFQGWTPPAAWAAHGALASDRCQGPAIALRTGDVLVVGGSNSVGGWTCLASCELRVAGSSAFVSTGPLHTPREIMPLVQALDGSVYVFGGGTDVLYADDTIEKYDPTTRAWTLLVGVMTEPRCGAATLLMPPTVQHPAGYIILVGGGDENWAELASAEIFDIATETCTAIGSMEVGRWVNDLVLFQAAGHTDGAVLVAGGNMSRYGAVLDIATMTFTPTTGMMAATRNECRATLLASGKVVVSGGVSRNNADVYNPATDTFAVSSNTMQSARFAHHAHGVAGGVLLAGGAVGVSQPANTTDIYVEATNSFTPGPVLGAKRSDYFAASLGEYMLIVGGRGLDGAQNMVLSSAEMFSPGTA